MNCKKCGTALPDGVIICPSCGEDNSVEQLDVSSENVEVLDTNEQSEVLEVEQLDTHEVLEETPVVEQSTTPVQAESTPVLEQPASQQTPVVESTPVVENTPVVEQPTVPVQAESVEQQPAPVEAPVAQTEVVQEQVTPTTPVVEQTVEKKETKLQNTSNLSINQLMNINDKTNPNNVNLDFVNPDNANVGDNKFNAFNGVNQSQLSSMLSLETEEAKAKRIRRKKMMKIGVPLLIIVAIVSFVVIKYGSKEGGILNNNNTVEVAKKEIKIGVVVSKIPENYNVQERNNKALIKSNSFAMLVSSTEGNIEHFIKDLDKIADKLSKEYETEFEYDENIVIDGKTFYIFYVPESKKKVFLGAFNEFYYLQGSIQYDNGANIRDIINILVGIIDEGNSGESKPYNYDAITYNYIPDINVQDNLFNLKI